MMLFNNDFHGGHAAVWVVQERLVEEEPDDEEPAAREFAPAPARR